MLVSLPLIVGISVAAATEMPYPRSFVMIHLLSHADVPGLPDPSRGPQFLIRVARGRCLPALHQLLAAERVNSFMFIRAAYVIKYIDCDRHAFHKYAVRCLTHLEPTARRGGLELFAVTGHAADVPQILPLIGDPNRGVSYEAIKTYAQLGTKADAKPLREWLRTTTAKLDEDQVNWIHDAMIELELRKPEPDAKAPK